MRRPYQIVGILFVLLSIFVVREALRLPQWGSYGPGPGFFPLWVGVSTGLLGAVMVLGASLPPSDPMPPDFFPSKAGYMRMAAIALALVGAVVLMEPLGFRLTMLGFLLLLLLGLGRRSLVLTSLVAIAGSFGTFYAFVEWLKVPLPIGILGI